jgi:hypothetical protein
VSPTFEGRMDLNVHNLYGCHQVQQLYFICLHV